MTSPTSINGILIRQDHLGHILALAETIHTQLSEACEIMTEIRNESNEDETQGGVDFGNLNEDETQGEDDFGNLNDGGISEEDEPESSNGCWSSGDESVDLLHYFIQLLLEMGFPEKGGRIIYYCLVQTLTHLTMFNIDFSQACFGVLGFSFEDMKRLVDIYEFASKEMAGTPESSDLIPFFVNSIIQFMHFEYDNRGTFKVEFLSDMQLVLATFCVNISDELVPAEAYQPVIRLLENTFFCQDMINQELSTCLNKGVGKSLEQGDPSLVESVADLYGLMLFFANNRNYPIDESYRDMINDKTIDFLAITKSNVKLCLKFIKDNAEPTSAIPGVIDELTGIFGTCFETNGGFDVFQLFFETVDILKLFCNIDTLVGIVNERLPTMIDVIFERTGLGEGNGAVPNLTDDDIPLVIDILFYITSSYNMSDDDAKKCHAIIFKIADSARDGFFQREIVVLTNLLSKHYFEQELLDSFSTLSFDLLEGWLNTEVINQLALSKSLDFVNVLLEKIIPNADFLEQLQKYLSFFGNFSDGSRYVHNIVLVSYLNLISNILTKEFEGGDGLLPDIFPILNFVQDIICNNGNGGRLGNVAEIDANDDFSDLSVIESYTNLIIALLTNAADEISVQITGILDFFHSNIGSSDSLIKPYTDLIIALLPEKITNFVDISGLIDLICEEKGKSILIYEMTVYLFRWEIISRETYPELWCECCENISENSTNLEVLIFVDSVTGRLQ